MNKVRMELIMSEAIQEEFLTDIDMACPGIKYTQVVDAKGRGNTTPKQGDAIWPQFNTIITIYCSREEAARVLIIAKSLRQKFPTEGVACFRSEAEEL
ncbi:MAG: hypothetical protein LBM77_07860 [Spirochaetaceae bacterium]|jgi:hypothetical protein|nr:hypothetical protein [Spirochaetaceae bacterium]